VTAGRSIDRGTPRRRPAPLRPWRRDAETVPLRWWVAAALGALILAAGTAGLAGYTADRSGAAAGPAGSSPATRYAVGTAQYSAARWLLAAVGAGQVVACDVAECAVLHSLGFPATSLIAVQSGDTDLEKADVVVSTPVLRQNFYAGLDTLVSAEPLAVFGSGTDRVEVGAIALDGPADFARRLSADRSARRAAGAELLANLKLALSPAARSELASGLIDNRVCALLALLSDTYSLSVTAFIPPGPSAGADIPWAGVVIGAVDGASAVGPAHATAELRTLVGRQQSPYKPMLITDVANSAGITPFTASGMFSPAPRGLEILFSEPGPLGLLTGTGP
jgi:hypothetical protein